MKNNAGLASFFGAARAAQVTSRLIITVSGPEVRRQGWDGAVLERIVCTSEEAAIEEFDRMSHGLQPFVPAAAE